MIVALHSFPKRSLGFNPPYSNENLIDLLKEAASLDFRAVELGPLADFLPIDGERLNRILNTLRMERSVHVGGTCDAEKLASSNEEYAKTKHQIINGVKLCRQISSSSVSIHPPFFTGTEEASEELASKAKYRFMNLVKKIIELANHIMLESRWNPSATDHLYSRVLVSLCGLCPNFLKRNSAFSWMLDTYIKWESTWTTLLNCSRTA